MDNHFLLAQGLAGAFIDFSSEKAGRLGALNTANNLVDVEMFAINQGRLCEVAPYTEYRAYVSLSRPQRFSDISSDRRVVTLLKDLYGSPERVEFYTGLFAEDTVKNSPLPPLILRLVAVDAFTQALTNPLLSEHVFNKNTFSEEGWRAIHSTNSLSDLIERNTPDGLNGAKVSMTQPGWTFQW